MNLSVKTKILNGVRNIFRIPVLEQVLVTLTSGKSPQHFFSKLIPNNYQYPSPSYRVVKTDLLKIRVDISDYIGHYIYFGLKDVSYDKLFELCKPTFNVIDIGTNIGFIALMLSRLAHTGKVAGFEPDPFNYNQAFENIKLNAFDNLSIYNVGLGEKASKAVMEIRTRSNRGGNRIAPTKHEGVEIVIDTLDSFFPKLEFASVDLIKIDVEGYELKVIKGAQNVIKNYKPILFIEVDDNNLRDQNDSAKLLIEYLVTTLEYRSIVHAETEQEIDSMFDFTNCHFDIIAR
jgi:FkbM family methyltransferase